MPTTTSPQQVHGHEVLDLIRSARPPLTRDALVGQVARRFGAGARFHTCAAQGMTTEGLLALLVARGKVLERDGALHVVEANVCGGAH